MQAVHGDFAERLRDGKQHPAQLRRFHERGDKPRAADPPVTESECGKHPCTLDHYQPRI
jgi:hypothetical protein